MLNWLRSLFASGPKKMMVASLKDPGYVVSTQLTPKDYPKKEEYSHEWRLDFAEPVRDGNDVSHLNLGVDGNIIQQYDLYSGEQTWKTEINPEKDQMEVITVKEDGDVHDMSVVEFREELVKE